jgi:hypothetical protein
MSNSEEDGQVVPPEDFKIVDRLGGAKGLDVFQHESLKQKVRHYAPEENDAPDLVHPTSVSKTFEEMMYEVVKFLESLGFVVDPEECSWKSITGNNGRFRLDIMLVEPKTTAAVTSTEESVNRHQLALDNYATSGKWIEPVRSSNPNPVERLKEERALGLRQARELSTFTNVQKLDSALQTERAYSVSGSDGWTACNPIYGEVTPGMDLAREIKRAIGLMLQQHPKLALGWTTPPPDPQLLLQ